jgi:DNA-directed RNA polymerase specialized sigma subunit
MSTKLQAKIRAEKSGQEFVDDTLPVKPSNTASHYVKNADLRNELSICRERGELTNQAVEMFTQIATKLSTRLKYTNEDDRQDCIAYAILDFCKYWKNYDPSVSPNAFAYCVSVATNGFCKGWRALGKIKCPDSLIISLSDNIYSL